jgi:hypothetical protein
MDPHKVDDILNWKILTSKELLQEFLGAVGFLADDVAEIRIPMGVFHSLTGSTAIFRWLKTHQCAFDQVHEYVLKFREHWHVPLKYEKGIPLIHLVTDACTTGIVGIISQGEDWCTAKVAAFFSAKLNPVQENYPIYELEIFVGVETMRRHEDILYGTKFTWHTDHKPLIHLLDQKNLSGRQARWIESLFDFDFDVDYVEGLLNVLSDALSRVYSNDAPGTVRSPSEYARQDEDYPPDDFHLLDVTMPVLVGLEVNPVETRS